MGQETQAGDGLSALQPPGPRSSFNTLTQADAIAELALSMALEFADASRGFLILLNEEGSIRYCFGRSAQGGTTERRPPDDVLEVMSLVRRAGHSVSRSVDDTAGPPCVCVPLMAENHMVGVLYLDRTDGAASFQPREERLVEMAAGQLAISLTARFLYEQITEKRKQVELIDRVSRAVAAPGDLDAVLKQVTDTAREALGGQGAALVLADDDGVPRMRYADGVSGDLLQHRPSTLGGSLVHAVLEEGAGQIHVARSTGSGRSGAVSAAVAVPVRQVLREKRLLNERRRSAYSVPFTRVMGVLYLENHDRMREFTEDDQLVLQVFADHVANAVSNDVLYRQASTDNLTGLASRRYLDLRLADELEFAQRNTCPLSVVMLDIDDFKQLNDQYGHQAGDEILRQIGAILKSSVRQFDVCGRYGGEEFILALPETDPQGAQVVAENVRERIAGSKFLDDEHPVPVTVSLGVATFPALASDLTSLIGAADRALYRAKRGGKNRYALAEERTRGAGE